MFLEEKKPFQKKFFFGKNNFARAQNGVWRAHFRIKKK